MATVLYITYDGLMEPLGQSQVWQYVSGLSAHHQILLLSYEKRADWENEAARSQVAAAVRSTGVKWIPLRYHSKPSAIATAFDIMLGMVTGSYLVLRYRIEIVHARSYVASVIALWLKKMLRTRFVFDMRGFWADERVDGGIWPKNSVLYHLAKWFEKQFLLNADVVVSLTQTAVKDMQAFSYMQGARQKFVVIPTCVNLQLFQPSATAPRRAGDGFVLGYAGSVGTWYLFDEVLRTFNALIKVRPQARLLIINRNEHATIRARLAAMFVDETKVELRSAAYAQMGQEISRMDAGVFYIKPVFSKRASAPTRLGEFLGCGVPCISNSGVGDTDAMLSTENVGVVLQAFDDEAHAQGVQALLELVGDGDTSSRCVRVAQRCFSLEQGIQAYDQIYQELV